MTAGSGFLAGGFAGMCLRAGLAVGLVALQPAAVFAQATSGQPAIDSDLVQPAAPAAPPPPPPSAAPAATPTYQGAAPAAAPSSIINCGSGRGSTYGQQDLISAAEGVFGKGAHGLAVMIQDILSKQGEPNGYIAGREASGAMIVGLRYGSGTLCHRTIPYMPVYWTGPSIGFDLGASAAKTFVLVYNLRSQDQLFKRFVAGEGQAYLVGGFHVSYLRHDDVVLIPVRMGVGLRLGVNGGYMKFTRKLNYLPF